MVCYDSVDFPVIGVVSLTFTHKNITKGLSTTQNKILLVTYNSYNSFTGGIVYLELSLRNFS